jgi:hypothetical protein
MKRRIKTVKPHIIPVALLLIVLSVGTYAADVERVPAAQAQTVEKAPAADAKTDAKATPVKPHSHVTDKQHIPQSAPGASDPNKKDPWKDKSKHFHPRDGK